MQVGSKSHWDGMTIITSSITQASIVQMGMYPKVNNIHKKITGATNLSKTGGNKCLIHVYATMICLHTFSYQYFSNKTASVSYLV